jgi:hypothetical protein
MKISRRDFVAAGVLSPIALALAKESSNMQPEPFKVEIEQSILDRIAGRVASAHMPRAAKGTDWDYGVDADWFRALLVYWRERYDWRAQERAINRLQQFTASVGDRRLHFVHHRSANPKAQPLVLLHGWPYSFWSFSEVIEPLTEDFHVVVPSLPGFAFSKPIADAPRGLRAMSGHIQTLMTDVLGYDRYLVQGSDFGAVVADWLALDHPDSLIGEHTNLVALRHKGAEYASGQTGLSRPTPAEQKFVEHEQTVFKRESAYFELQRTRPETIADAMTDSPVAWPPICSTNGRNGRTRERAHSSKSTDAIGFSRKSCSIW